MGISYFICKLNGIDSLISAINCIREHNASPFENTGARYTEQEFKLGDPIRYDHYKMLSKMKLPRGVELECGVLEKWTRGENIVEGGSLVLYKGHFWLSVINRGGGLCTTKWLQEHHPEIEWIGTEGKPKGWHENMETINATPYVSYNNLLKFHTALLEK
jgi:hypothetical protein